MPSIPQYNDRLVKIAPAATPSYTVQATAKQFGSETATSLGTLGEKVEEAGVAVAGLVARRAKEAEAEAARKKAEEDKAALVNGTRAVDLFNQFEEKRQAISDSYQSLQGKLAVDGYDATVAQYARVKRDILTAAPDEQVAKLVGAAIDSQVAFSLGQMQRYRDQQQGVYEDGVSETRIGLARDGVARSYNDDAAFTRNLHVADRELAHQLTRNGGEPAAIATARAGQVSRFWRDRGEAAIAHQDLAGSQRYLDQAKDLLTPGDRAAWSARLQDAVTNDKADQETRRILRLPVPGAPPVSASPVGAPSGGDASQAGAGPQGPASGGRISALETGPRPPDLPARLAEAEKIADPALRAQVKRNVSLATAREQVAYRANQRQLKAQARQVVDGGGGFSAIPYDVWTGMDRAGKDALAAYALAGGQVTTDPLIFYRLRDLALDHPQDFLDTDLNDHIHQVDAKDLASLTALQATLRDKGPDDPQVNLLRSYKANTDRVLRQLGVLPAIGTSEDATASTAEGKAASESTPSAAAGDDGLQARIIATFRRDVDIALSAHEAATGRKATPAEQQQIVDQVATNLRRIQTEYGGWSSKAAYSETDTSGYYPNPLLVRTAGGDVQMADATNGEVQQNEGADENGASNVGHLRRGLEPLIAGPEAPPFDRLYDEGVRDRVTWDLPFPNGSSEPSYKGEMKAMGPDAGKAATAIRHLERWRYWPVAGDHVLNKADSKSEQGDGRFGMTRTRDGKKVQHQGIDITVKEGTPVKAVKGGVVVAVVNNFEGYKKGSYGNYVIIDHEDGTSTLYAHLNPAVDEHNRVIKNSDGTSRIALKIKGRVEAGQLIGESGKTGNAATSKDAHLHFEVRYGDPLLDQKNRTIFNPMYFLPVDQNYNLR